MNHYEDVKKSPLFVAREKGRSDIIKLLLNNGAAVNVCGTETNSKKPNKYCLYVGILTIKAINIKSYDNPGHFRR